jgi:tetratricopeptide (TPR) repeat protein
MKKYILSFGLLLYFFSLFSQDSLVHYSEINFSSTFESTAFEDYFTRKKIESKAHLFLSANSNTSIESSNDILAKIEKLCNSIKSLGFEKKKPEKQIKTIYDQVHSEFLRKYELENRFHEIFSNGNYNCVTATALFSLVFEKLNIPYTIKEEPTHVYLIAYPNSQNILVETTTPLFGYLSFDSNFKNKFVTNLKSQKIIGSSEAESSSVEELFNKYYFQNENIGLDKLVGIHYLNDALFYNDHGDHHKAFQQAEKAYLFYPSQRCQYLITQFGIEILAKEKLTPKERSLFISKLSRYKNQGVTNEMIKGEFSNLTQDILFKENNKTLYKECFEIIVSTLKDKDLHSSLSYIFYYENGRVYYNQGNFIKAKSFFSKALSLQPNNVDLGGTFVNVLSATFRKGTTNKSVMDTLRYYKEKFPPLEEINSFNSMVAITHAVHFGEEFNQGHLEEAEKYKAMFESMYPSDKMLNVDSSVIGMAYSAACTFYFKKGQKTKARAALEKGLSLAPDSYELRLRKQMLSN